MNLEFRIHLYWTNLVPFELSWHEEFEYIRFIHLFWPWILGSLVGSVNWDRWRQQKIITKPKRVHPPVTLRVGPVILSRAEMKNRATNFDFSWPIRGQNFWSIANFVILTRTSTPENDQVELKLRTVPISFLSDHPVNRWFLSYFYDFGVMTSQVHTIEYEFYWLTLKWPKMFDLFHFR